MNAKFTKKRLLSAVIAICMAISVFSPFVLAQSVTLEGDGTADSPYLIGTEEELIKFADMVNAAASPSYHARLTEDIELSSQWTPMSAQTYVTETYSGIFDGDFHKISGLDVDEAASGRGVGFFDTVNGATIKNLQLEGRVSAGNSNYVGGIVGRTQGAVTIENCLFAGEVISGKSNSSVGVGGIAGRVNSGSILIKSCVNNAAVTGNGGAAAGILGYGGANVVSIENCYNTGAVSGQWYASGICAHNTKNTSVITSCYNIGTVTNSNGGMYLAGISANFRGAVTGAYYKYPETENKNASCTGEAVKIDLPSEVIAGDAFTEDVLGLNDGYPILKWQEDNAPLPKNPHISVSGDKTLYMVNSGAEPQTTLSVLFTDMDEEEIEWSVKDDSDIIALEAPVDTDAYNSRILVKAVKAGKATIVAKVKNSDKYIAEHEINVMPFVTTVEIEGIPAVGETVKAKVNVLGGSEYDYENYPELSFQWKYLTGEDYASGNTGSSSYKIINGAVSREFTIPEDMSGCYISFEFIYNGEYKVPSRPSEVLESIPTVEPTAAPTVAPTVAPTIAPTAEPTVEPTATPTVAPTAEPTVEPTATPTIAPTAEPTVEPTATPTVAPTVEPTVIPTVEPTPAVTENPQLEKEEELRKKLQEIKDALGSYYKITPVFDSDTNVIDILKSDVEDKGIDCSELGIDIMEVEEIYGGAGIAENGDITYFYADPNTIPSIKMGSYKVKLAISLDNVSEEIDVPVIIYWDRDKVKSVMKEEILDKVTEESILGSNTSLNHVTENLSLPKTVDNKKWTLISWQSSDSSVISVSGKNQATADTLFNPYVGEIKRGAEDKEVTLTATFSFQLTNDMTGNEKTISMSKVFPVTVKAIGAEQIEEIEKELTEKLDSGFDKTGISDFVTGQRIIDKDGKYTVYNDIVFPATRDFGIDGKYYPVSITSDNREFAAAPDVNNATRVEIYRPAVGKSEETAKITLTITDTNSKVSASKTFDIIIPPFTQAEVDKEKALMNTVKASYFDGIKGKNLNADDVSQNLLPFLEAYEENGKIVWVRSEKDKVNHGIIPVQIEGWEELESWRLFKSSNSAAVTHESLMVTMQKKGKAVKVSSALSSETLGKYGKLYKSDSIKYADYADFADLYYQEVSADIVVRGTSTPLNARPMAYEERINVSFALQDSSSTLFSTSYKNLNEGTTVFDVLKKAFKDGGYTYKSKGSYIYSVTTPDGREIAELSEGENSGWLYKVNGEIPEMNMSAYGLKDGDKIIVYFTKDYTEDFKHSSSSSKAGTVKTPQPSDRPSETDKPSELLPQTTQKPEFNYTDTKNHWADEAIKYVSDLGIMQGTDSNKFNPDGRMTRAMMAAVLYRLDNAEPTGADSIFSDVTDDKWYYNAVVWASDNNIVSGIDDAAFAPDDDITREQMAAMLYRYAQYKKYSTETAASLTAFDDYALISEWAKEAFEWAVGSNVISGTDENMLLPNGYAVRAQAASVIMRFADCFVKEVNVYKDEKIN